jgi:hypothetical protein
MNDAQVIDRLDELRNKIVQKFQLHDVEDQQVIATYVLAAVQLKTLDFMESAE